MKRNRDILISGFALFSMFFGAGNLIFPPTLGLQMGDAWIPAMLGFLATGVGLVMLAVIATAKTGGSIYDIGKNISRPFAILFGTLVILSIGPGLAIPRTAATTHEILEGALFPGLSPLLTSIIFFGLVLFFVLSPGTMIDRLGTILTPALLFTLCIIIVKAIFSPLGVPATLGETEVFGRSFVEGYQTMDAIAALVFTSVIIEGYRLKGIQEEHHLMKHTISASIIASIGLSIIYGGILYMGATASGMALGEMGRVDLLIYCSKSLLGTAGTLFMSLAMGLACLTTAIGLTATVGTFFEDLFQHKIPYKVLVVISSLFSGYFAIRGVDSIVAISAPILSALYPVAIVLIFVNLFTQHFQKRSTQIGAVLGAFLPTVFLLLSKPLGVNVMEAFEEYFPLAVQSFVWIIPVIILGFIFTFIPIPEIRKQR
ncbi:MAG: branched-chain amino acid transport system II carrier protein [Tissierellia bacterium]|nr:branched-chain amino acid transport system II carrier protein [Tissierellia bacterium]